MKRVRVNEPWGTAATMGFAVLLALAAPARSAAPPAAPGDGLLAATAAAVTPEPAKPARKQKKAKQPKQPKVKAVAHVHKPEDGPWDGGANWVMLRAGYGNAAYRTAGSGYAGYGFGFTHMLNSKWALAGLSELDVIGKFGDASESEIPFTLELDRHINLGDQFRPYFGLGGGTYYHKFSKTGLDASAVRGGGFLAVGANTVISPHGLLGFDARVAFVSNPKGAPPPDPVFGAQDQTTTQWSYKVVWSITY